MNILEQIVFDKRKEVQKAKELTSIKELEKNPLFERKGISLSNTLRQNDQLGIIAEIKRSSPSTKALVKTIDVQKISTGYIESGASALSVLTDKKYFDGTIADLNVARKYNACPILRKDFVIDEYQIIESKSIGADCILLIAACLEPKTTSDLAKLAKSFGLDVLLEVHDEAQINTHLNPYIDIIGVNNRDLRTFKTDIQTSIDLYPLLPKELCKISESGITNGNDICQLTKTGFDGFLIGGHFMKSGQPAIACKKIIDEYKSTANEG